MASLNQGKRKRVSKNKKKNWKKTDIQDVEEHLEDTRLQERTGGLVAEKSDDALFFIETAVKQENDDTTQNQDDEQPVPKKRKREPKPLKCHALLEPDPRIKPFKVKRNVRQDSIKKRCTAIQERQEQGVVSFTQKQAQQDRQIYQNTRKQKLKAKRTMATTSYDLWGETAAPAGPVVKKKIKVKPSDLPAVEAPHPGSSYNPTLEDHQELLQSALEAEEAKVREEQKERRALDAQFPKASEAPTQETWLQEMSAGLGADEEPYEAGQPEEGDGDRLSNNPPVRRDEKKTEKQRKKEKQRQLQEKEVQQEKAAKQKKQEVFRLKSIKKAVREQEADLEDQAKRREYWKEQRSKDRPQKLGKHKYEAPNLEIKLSDELEGSLRLLKPEGNLLEDRYKSLQRRNIIEPRKRAKRVKKYKPKFYTKKGHKDLPS